MPQGQQQSRKKTPQQPMPQPQQQLQQQPQRQTSQQIQQQAPAHQPPAGRNYYFTEPYITSGGDTIPQMVASPLYFFSMSNGRRVMPQQQVDRLVRNVKAVYPIARAANAKLVEMEAHLLTLATDKERDRYIKQVENELKAQYTPILKEMTYSQGKILIKLIDRETSHTSYELVKRFRGSLSAFFWQSIARLFSANLKESYDAEGEDQAIEQIIKLYEAGAI
jgi:hypothetical protein